MGTPTLADAPSGVYPCEQQRSRDGLASRRAHPTRPALFSDFATAARPALFSTSTPSDHIVTR
jgi:hypothetical protein